MRENQERFFDSVADVPQERDAEKEGRHSAQNDRWLLLLGDDSEALWPSG